MKIFTFIGFLFIMEIFAKDITPYKYINASEAVSDFIKKENTLIIGTREGIIDIYDFKEEKAIDKIVLEKQTNIFGEKVGLLIISVDYLDGTLVFATRNLETLGELYIYKDKKLLKLIDAFAHMSIQEVKFVDANTLIINTMGNELILFDIKEKRFLYRKQLNSASFSDLTLSEDKKYLFTADETPLINKIEIKSGNIVEVYEKANKRDIASIDYKNGLLLSGGKDQQLILYKTPNQYKTAKGDFFINSVALNPDADRAAFTKNDKDEISILDTNSLKESYLLKGHKTTIIKIDFYAPNELISADKANKLMVWKLN
jgi:WD40 repeat protein